jgi:hypothetical protein
MKPPDGWPKPDYALIAAATSSGRGFADLTARSPVPLNPAHTARDYLQALFAPQDMSFLCTSPSLPQMADTAPWLGFKHSDRPALVVPSLMDSQRGKKDNGDTSRRCASMVSRRLYLVVETDFRPDKDGAESTPAGELMRNSPHLPSPKELSAGVAHHWLDLGWPVALILFSGGKSVHSWLATWAHDDDTEAARMFSHATALGADAALWTPCQPVRVPEGRREDGREQPVLYIDPRFMLGELPVIDY